MALVQAYQCPHTGKLFALEDKVKYEKHRDKAKREIDAQKKHEDALKNIDGFFTNMRETVTSLAELEHFILTNSEMFITNGKRNYWGLSSKHKFDLQFLKVEIRDCRFRPDVSNGHSAPIGKEQNWGGRKEGVPTSYPGWKGKIIFSYNENARYPGSFSGMFDGTGVYLGSGSGGGKSYQSELILWEDDWPGLAKVRLMDRLSGK